MDRAGIYLVMEIALKECFRIINARELVCILLKMVEWLRGFGIIISLKEAVNRIVKLVRGIWSFRLIEFSGFDFYQFLLENNGSYFFYY